MYKLTACTLTLIYYIVVFISGVVYGEVCKTFNDCECVLANSSVINLRPITNDDGSPRYKFLLVEDKNADNNETELFFYNPCFKFYLGSGFPPPQKKEDNCTDAFGCQVVVQKDGNPYQEKIISSKVKPTYSSSEIIYEDNERKLKVSLNCSYKLDEPMAEISKNGTEYNLILMSKCACVDGCKNPKPPTVEPPSKQESKLSGGSVLLIIFFTFLAIYVFGGIMWNAFCLGASGIEMLPNLEFWREFPALVVDGARFSLQCCKTRTTYNDI